MTFTPNTLKSGLPDSPIRTELYRWLRCAECHGSTEHVYQGHLVGTTRRQMRCSQCQRVREEDSISAPTPAPVEPEPPPVLNLAVTAVLERVAAIAGPGASGWSEAEAVEAAHANGNGHEPRATGGREPWVADAPPGMLPGLLDADVITDLKARVATLEAQVAKILTGAAP